LKDFYDETNEDEAAWMAFLEAWKEVFDDLPITVSELADRVSETDDERKTFPEKSRILRESLPPFLAEAMGRSEGSFKRLLGNALSKRAKMRFPNGLYVEKYRGDSHRKVAKWQICGVLANSSPQNQPIDFTRESTTPAGTAGTNSPLTHERKQENGNKEYRESYREQGGIDPAVPADPANGIRGGLL
jgi:hypothetical protein